MKPVLLVHGWSDSHMMPWWDQIEEHLIDEGFEQEKIKRVNLGSPGLTIGSPREYAREVREEALELYEETERNISIIAHSMGGLNSRYFIEVLNGHKIVDNLLTLGTPHKGTKRAYLGYFSRGGREMIPESEFIERLNKDGLHDEVNYTALWSTKDFLISPKDCAKLPEKHMTRNDNNIKIEDRGHLRMVLSNYLFSEYLNHICKCKI